MVSNSALAAITVLTGLHRCIQHSTPDLDIAIQRFAEEVTRRRDEEENAASRECRLPGQYWVELETPKVTALL